jgi:hypothetical protein
MRFPKFEREASQPTEGLCQNGQLRKVEDMVEDGRSQQSLYITLFYNWHYNPIVPCDPLAQIIPWLRSKVTAQAQQLSVLMHTPLCSAFATDPVHHYLNHANCIIRLIDD